MNKVAIVQVSRGITMKNTSVLLLLFVFCHNLRAMSIDPHLATSLTKLTCALSSIPSQEVKQEFENIAALFAAPSYTKETARVLVAHLAEFKNTVQTNIDFDNRQHVDFLTEVNRAYTLACTERDRLETSPRRKNDTVKELGHPLRQSKTIGGSPKRISIGTLDRLFNTTPRQVTQEQVDRSLIETSPPRVTQIQADEAGSSSSQSDTDSDTQVDTEVDPRCYDDDDSGD